MQNGQEPDQIGGIDEGLLNAYIDGELDQKERGEIERQLESDPVAARYVKQIGNMDRLVRSALDEAVAQPLSRSLLRSVDALNTRSEQNRSPVRWQQPSVALAASLLLLALGFGAGLFTAERQFSLQLAMAENIRSQALEEVGKTLNQVLEHSPSGQAVDWQSEQYDVSAQLIPVRTLKTADQRYCREYREILIIDGQREERHGLSCRTGKENWETRLLVPEGGKAIF